MVYESGVVGKDLARIVSTANAKMKPYVSRHSGENGNPHPFL